MSRFLNALFGPDVPVWACELTPTEAVVVRASDDRRAVRGAASQRIQAGALSPDLKKANVLDPSALRGAVGRCLDEAGFFGSEIVVVIPDDAVRMALIDVDSFPSADEEQRAFIRWKFKKSVPFDVDSARVTWDTIAAQGSVRLMAVLTPESVIRQYEEIPESFGLHAGLVVPSTLGALGLLSPDEGDVLLVKKSATSITTSIVVAGQMRFYRKVAIQPLYEATYPTFVYYQDKLQGGGLSAVILCGDGVDPDEKAELEQGIGVRAGTLLSADIEDTYKPALGALRS